jgi:hypothetical protein
MASSKKKTAKNLKSHCRVCCGEANHVIVESVNTETERDGVLYRDSHQIVQCIGCENHSFRLVSSNSQRVDPDTGQRVEEVEAYPFGYYPFRDRGPIAGSNTLPKPLRGIYCETLDAMNHKNLVTVGSA